jgi:hypothetical protein
MLYGVGLNDSDYPVTVHEKVNGKDKIVWRCSFYDVWSKMIERCCSKKLHAKHQTYAECYVDESWHRFSVFREWMIKQDWKGKCLDKDLLFRGNKRYGQDTCVFIDKSVNLFLINAGAARGKFPIGVCWNSRDSIFQSRCCNPITKKQETVGLFKCPEQAHAAWQIRKHQHALAMADTQKDQRVAESLRAWFAPGTSH